MMSLRFSLLFSCMLLLGFVNAQMLPYPQQYFQSPMDTPLYLSAPFGSLRDNHFHSGMDIRTYEREGLPVYAAADGYIVRIKYSPFGYGKAIYINHPNGYTTVYGHLQNAKGPIADYIKKYQYQIQRFDFDHFPAKDKLYVKKGDTIGWSGNSGGSTGPHLHFEIRNTRTEEILNPQLFGVPVVDTEAPVMKQLFVYTFDVQGSKLNKTLPFNFKNSILTDSGTVLLDTVLVPFQPVGFAMDAADYMVGKTKEYSLYGMDLRVDGKSYYKYRLDRFMFSDSRCVNLHIDYALYKKDGYRVQKMFADDGNTIKLYSYKRNKGKYTPTDTLVHLVECTAYDYAMRYARAYMYIKAVPMNLNKEVSPFEVVTCYPAKQTAFQNAYIKVEVPPKALYDTLKIEYEMLAADKKMLSATHRVHHIYTPLQKNIVVSVKPDTLIRLDKMLLAYSPNGKFWRSAGGEFANGFVTTRTNVFGMYAVALDTLAPVVTPLFKNKRQEVDSVSLKFKIIDDFSGIDTYRLLINGKWALAEYDAKNDLLEYFFDPYIFGQKFDIELTVRDNKANETVFKMLYIIGEGVKERPSGK